MDKSNTIKELATALSKAQAEMPAAPFNSTNPFFKSKYADLGSIIKTAQPILAKYGLSVSQHPVGASGNLGVCTILMHTSGEYLESTVFLPIGDEQGKNIAQAAGSVFSYLRRYSLAAVLGMYTDEDTDANSPAQAPKQQPAPASTNPLKEAAAEKPATNGSGFPTPEKMEKWNKLVKRAQEVGVAVPPLPAELTADTLAAAYANLQNEIKQHA